MNVLGASFVLGSLLLYAHQLSKITNLFLKGVGDSVHSVILNESNIVIFSLAYLGTMVTPALSLFIGIGFFRMKRWLPELLEIGFVVGSIFVLNGFVLSY